MTSDGETGGGIDAQERRVAGLRRHARERQEEAREAIREAAATLFCAKGYSEVTLDELAGLAGVTRQTLYRHYPGKYEIALDFMDRANAEASDVWKSLEAHDLRDRKSVLAWVRSVIDWSAKRDHFRAYVELTSTEPQYRAVLASQIGRIVAALSPVHPFFAAAAEDPEGLAAAKAHLFVASLMERSDFIAIGEEWFAREHLEEIMADWLMQLTR